MGKRLTLLLGGRRAGKSSYAQRMAKQNEERGDRVLFVATAEARDDDMAARILRHQQDRPAAWDTLEEPLDLVRSLAPVVSSYDTVMLDCMTLWVSNLMTVDTPRDPINETRGLINLFRQQTADWIVVSNEVGLGIIPPNQIARDYSDQLGRVNQLVAEAADEVLLIAAGLALTLKPQPAT